MNRNNLNKFRKSPKKHTDMWNFFWNKLDYDNVHYEDYDVNAIDDDVTYDDEEYVHIDYDVCVDDNDDEFHCDK